MKRSVLIVFLVLLSASATGESLRCRGQVVKVGDSANTLVRKCGNPLRKYSSKETISDGGRRSLTGVSNWVYARGGKKDMIVSVRSGSVVKIHAD